MRILVINLGSTSTKIGIYESDSDAFLFNETLVHTYQELLAADAIDEKIALRFAGIWNFLKKHGIDIKSFTAIASRGGLLAPMAGGTYRINELMAQDLRLGTYGEHASNLGGIIAYELSTKYNIPAYIVDPVIVDELSDLARFTGLKGTSRKSIFHALNQKAVARKTALEHLIPYEKANLIIAHMGGGISIGAHRNGRVIDVNNALSGDGPFSPERSGALPNSDIIELCFAKNATKESVLKKLIGQGGLISYLGTNDCRSVTTRINKGDKYAAQVLLAMAYQISKEIGALSSVFFGRVDLIVLTGGLAHCEKLVVHITKRIKFIAPVIVKAGEMEMEALASGVSRVLTGEAKILEYTRI